jgi:hypothetical protein
MRASGCFLTSTRRLKGHRRDAVPQNLGRLVNEALQTAENAHLLEDKGTNGSIPKANAPIKRLVVRDLWSWMSTKFEIDRAARAGLDCHRG